VNDPISDIRAATAATRSSGTNIDRLPGVGPSVIHRITPTKKSTWWAAVDCSDQAVTTPVFPQGIFDYSERSFPCVLRTDRVPRRHLKHHDFHGPQQVIIASAVEVEKWLTDLHALRTGVLRKFLCATGIGSTRREERVVEKTKDEAPPHRVQVALMDRC